MPGAEDDEEEASTLPPASSESPPHATIPHDELVGERTAAARIGVGRFGEVFRAQLRRAGPVAVKCVPPLMDYRLEFDRHIKLSMTMDGVCRMHGLCEEHPVFGTCFVMKLYERSLADEIEANGAMEPSRAADIAATIAATMAELHDPRQILVADLKPANVLIDKRGRPVISDFGVSQQIGTAMLSRGISSARGGTVQYMSPEQLGAEDEDENEIRVTLQSDVWSFGCTLLHMLTGALPWMKSDGRSMSDNRVTANVGVRMRAPPVPASVPDELRALLKECLQPLAGDRPSFGGDDGIAARLYALSNPAVVAVDEEEESECVVCMDKPRTHSFVPCGHRCVCAECSALVMQTSPMLCPCCRAPARESIQTFL
jgi:E3 ubiquitin-protein ligase KEG